MDIHSSITVRVAVPVAAALLGASPLLSQAYTVTDIGNLPGGNYVYAGALNERGDATGVSSSSSGSRAILYTDAGGTQDLGVLPGATSSRGSGVTELRLVVGRSGLGAFRWNPGASIGDLIPGVQASAFAANNRGEVVGYMRPTPTAQETPFLLRNGTVTQLVNGAYGWALDINESGAVIGTWGGLGGSIWDAVNGSRPIPVLPGFGSNNLGAINDRGVVAGMAWSNGSGGTGAWFRYTPGVGIVNLGSGAHGHVSDINNRGDIVGQSVPSSRARASIYTDQNGFQDLNTLIPSALGYVLLNAVAINDAGQILCEAVSGPLCCRRTLRLDPVVRRASATPLGIGCGSGPTPPTLSALPPVLGGTLSLSLSSGPPNALGILVAHIGAPFAAPLGPCTVYFDQSPLPIAAMSTDATGNAGHSMSVPAIPALSGAWLTVQTVLVGSAAPPGVDLSNGVLLILGS